MARRIMDSKNKLWTSDFIDPNELWRDYQDSLEDYNATSNGLVDLLTFRTTDKTFSVLQGAYEFEDYADYTLPDSQDLSYLELSVGIKDFDLRYAFTWARILESTASELDGRHAAALQADTRLLLKQVIRAALTKEGLTLGGVTSPAFYNADGTVPPPVKNTTFSGSHTHYLATTGGTLAAADLDRIEDDLVHHGFVSDIILMVNRAQVRTIQGFTGFVPSSTLTHDIKWTNLVGDPYFGSYGIMAVLEEDWIPAGYLFAFSAQGGPGGQTAPIAFRESTNPAARGLILQRGTNPEYPLADSFYYRKFGVGVRQRGNGVAMFITGGGSYTSPVI
jgi:hypothetical protein